MREWSVMLDCIERLAGSRAVPLELLPWPSIAQLQKQCHGMLILPLGATEQHGPHLPINTDTVIANAACWYASAKSGVPVLPALSYTVSAGHTAKWPGTFSLWHETFIATLRELAAWSAATGWKRLLLVNAHFGNDASMRAAVDQIRLEHLGRLQVGCRNVFSLTPNIWASYTRDAADLHANQAETDLMLFLMRDQVRKKDVADDPDRTEGLVFNYPVAQTSLNGVTGTPSLATAEAGKELFLQIGGALAELVDRGKTELPPLPSDEWEGVPKLRPAFISPST